MSVDLRHKIEEARVTKEYLNKLLVDNDKENENIKLEVVSLRKKTQENNMSHSSQILSQIIDNKRPVYDKTGIGYKTVETNGC